MESLGKIYVDVLENGAIVAEKRFKNPPRPTAEIKAALKEAGYGGELVDSEGDTLFGSDLLEAGQKYVLHVVPGMLLCCYATMHLLE